MSALAEWCTHWLDVSESNPTDQNGLLGAIHSVTNPERRGDATFFSVDFGTAQVAAVEALLKVLVGAGASDIRIASSWART